MSADETMRRLRDEAHRLRARLAHLAREAERDPVLERYPPRFGRLRLGLYRRARLAVGDVLRGLGLKAPPPRSPWRPGLRHAPRTETAGALVIWALGTDRDTLRQACDGLKRIEAHLLPDLVPVLVTDVEDFAFFSRLGWLVEHVPTLSAPAAGYAERKARYLAWRYRDAPALPAAVGLVPDLDAGRVRELIALADTTKTATAEEAKMRSAETTKMPPAATTKRAPSDTSNAREPEA